MVANLNTICQLFISSLRIDALPILIPDQKEFRGEGFAVQWDIESVLHSGLMG